MTCRSKTEDKANLQNYIEIIIIIIKVNFRHREQQRIGEKTECVLHFVLFSVLKVESLLKKISAKKNALDHENIFFFLNSVLKYFTYLVRVLICSQDTFSLLSTLLPSLGKLFLN